MKGNDVQLGRKRATASLVAGDAVALIALAPNIHRLRADLSAPHAWFAREGTDAAMATLAAAAIWLVAAWLAIGLLAAAVARLPGLAGALSARLCRLLLPQLVRNLLAGGAGLGVLLAPVAAGAVADHHLPSRNPVPATAASVPTPMWPVTPGRSSTVPTPRWPSAPAPRRAPSTRSQRPTPSVTVAPGDSLWLITARRLGPQATADGIAASWPRWYAANRDVIGDDPALITPGLVLHAPAAPAEETRS